MNVYGEEAATIVECDEIFARLAEIEQEKAELLAMLEQS